MAGPATLVYLLGLERFCKLFHLQYHYLIEPGFDPSILGVLALYMSDRVSKWAFLYRSYLNPGFFGCVVKS